MSMALRLLVVSITIALLHVTGIEGEDTCQLWSSVFVNPPQGFNACNNTDQCLGIYCEGTQLSISSFGLEFLPCNQPPQLTLTFNANGSYSKTYNVSSTTSSDVIELPDVEHADAKTVLKILLILLDSQDKGNFTAFSLQLVAAGIDSQNSQRVYLFVNVFSVPIPKCEFPEPTSQSDTTATGLQETTPGVVQQTYTATAVRQATEEQTITQAGGSHGSTGIEATISMITHSSADSSTKQPVVPVKSPVKLFVSRRCRRKKYWRRNSRRCCKQKTFKARHQKKCSKNR